MARFSSTLAWLRFAAVVLATVALTGCYSRLTGNDARFTFGYLTDVQVENFNKPIAPGARLDLVAFKNAGGDDQYRVVSASSSNPKVLSVVSVSRQHAVVEGIHAGTAQITMTVRRVDGTTLEDSVFMSVARPTKLELFHSCTDTPRAAYVALGDLAVPFRLRARDGRAVVGYRYLPVQVEPKDALEFVSHPRQFSEIIFWAGPPSEDVRITSRVDDTSLSLRIVHRSDVDTIEAEPAASSQLTAVGYETLVGFYPMAGSDPVCQSEMLTKASSLTPDICQVSADLDQNGSDWNRAQAVRIKGVGFGICRYEIIFPEASGGDGLTGEFTIPVGKFPESDASENLDANMKSANMKSDTMLAGTILAAKNMKSDTVAAHTQKRHFPWYLGPLLALLAPLLLAPWAWVGNKRR